MWPSPPALAAVTDFGYVPHAVLGCYLLALIGIGVVGFLRSKATEEDYYLAGRRQGFIVTALTCMATFFSSFALLGAAGVVYKDGLAYFLFALNLPVSGGAVYILGSRISRLGRAKGYVTPADMVADYYGSSVALRILVALVGFLYVVPYVVMQIRAGGYLADRMFPDVRPVTILGDRWDMFALGSTAMSIIMMLYIIVGGMRSVAWADVVQGTLLMLGMVLAGLATMAALGGVGGYFREVSKLPTESLSLPGLSGAWPAWKLMTVCMFASSASMIQPGQWMRYYAARSSNTLRRSALIFAALLGCCYLFGIMFVGLGAKRLYPLHDDQGRYCFKVAANNPQTEKVKKWIDPKTQKVDWKNLLPNPRVGQKPEEVDQVVIAVIQDERHGLPKLLGPIGVVVACIILVAILAASTSTADSNLHALSGVLTRDVYDRFVHPGAGQKERAWVGRGIIVAATLLALWLVHKSKWDPYFQPLQLIAKLGFVAMGFSCQLLPITIDMLFVRRGTRPGAIAGMIAGIGVVFFFTPFPQMMTGAAGAAGKVYSLFDELKRLFDIGFCGFVVNVAVFFLVSLFTKRPDPQRVGDMARIMDGKKD